MKAAVKVRVEKDETPTKAENASFANLIQIHLHKSGSCHAGIPESRDSHNPGYGFQ